MLIRGRPSRQHGVDSPQSKTCHRAANNGDSDAHRSASSCISSNVPNVARVLIGYFASFRKKGRIPRSASKCGKDYLRPAAVAAAVIAQDDSVRFGWTNLRPSLATFFGSNEVQVSVIPSMLRHTKPTTTARYIHAVNSKQLEAQGKYLEAIKLGKNGKKAA
jgi:hypothetical protein